MEKDIRNDQIVERVNQFVAFKALWCDYTAEEKEEMVRYGSWYLLADCEDADVLCVVSH